MEKHLPLIINGQIVSTEENRFEISFEEKKVKIDSFNHVHLTQMVTHDYLNDLNINNIINFLYTTGQRWKSEEYSRRRAYIRSLITYLGYSPQMAKLEANWIAMILCSKSALYDIIDTELGSTHIQDEWLPQGECYVRAFPKGRTMHLLAGNVPLSGVTSILRGILTRNQCIVRMSASDPFTAHALAMSFIDVDPNHPISRSISVLYWPHTSDTTLAEELLSHMDAVVAWGGRDAIDWAVKHSPSHIDVLKFGPKKSFTVLDHPADLEEAASGVAHDICFYDQNACFSTQNIYFSGDKYEEFKSKLVEKLNLYQEVLPKSKQSFDDEALFSMTRLECQFSGLKVISEPENNWMIIESEPGVEYNHPLSRCVYIHKVNKVDDVVQYIEKHQTQTISFYPWESSKKYRDAFAAKGVERIVESGMNNIFRAGGAHDAMRPLQRLVRFVSHERPYNFTTKDVSVEIEQTRFLEEDKFLVFVP
ncbi:long-chain-fatty-acyl-CoA reductase LuxC [Vibrio campbellii]|uniref:long-chain-fatty-acyl-CoA reductase LuxC n=1 Tax=Vibrio campbellii TaxID=680 RepID=UPI00067FAE27|nr:aldehyde dehydrogenase family protein [Vibrio campbellii]APX08376.1 acyl-CoA reductase [Vibrio campbellii]ARR09436.1 acyl-CoA reductase [Vibrio campbellii]NIY86211.1 aldehyde dehydrogenase family protein [Vibrio campbellii]NVK70568.1 aldehyde dehydrogenase family protein [Vibrio campbellii]HDM8206817.1 aldehyde dehydrogenase family protein [Vibrio campbellii]